MTGLRTVQPMRATGALLDMVVRQHGTPEAADVPALPPGLVGEQRRFVFGYLGLELPEKYRADLDGHAAVGESNRTLQLLAAVADVVDATWQEDPDGARAALVELGADVIRWIQTLDADIAGVTS